MKLLKVFGLGVLLVCFLWFWCCAVMIGLAPIAKKVSIGVTEALGLSEPLIIVGKGMEDAYDEASEENGKLDILLREYDQQLATLGENKWGLLYYFNEYHVRLNTTGEFRQTEDADPVEVAVTLEMHKGKSNQEAGSFLVFDVTNPANNDNKIANYRINGTYAISLKGENEKNWNDTYEVTYTDASTFKCEKSDMYDNMASLLCRSNTVDVELYDVNAKSGRNVLTFTIPCGDFTEIWEKYKNTEIAEKP